MNKKNPYPPISDYAYIADCHSAALISKSGSIDWCCMPRIDSGSCFGRILDWNNGGYCQISPSSPYQVSRAYLEDTLILETTFRQGNGETRLLDFFTMRKGGEHHPHQQVLRILEGIKGETQFEVDIDPRFDYGAIRPWIRQREDHSYTLIGGPYGLFVSFDFRLEMKHRHRLTGSCTVEAGDRRHLSILYRKPENLDENTVYPPEIEELDRRLDETLDWWRTWTSKSNIETPYAEYARRSAIVLKGLSNAPTGAIAAAATTSLPEAPAGERNWDYRFTWIRDSTFTVQALANLGYVGEADGFRRFVERTAAGSAEDIQILFGVGGERRLKETEIKELEGYRGAGPVRVGNAAENQIQLDVYGELLELSRRWSERGNTPDDDYWEFLVELVNAAAEKWRHPDQGIWEMRGEPRHFVHSKAMCWVAMDCGIKLAQALDRKAPVDRWKKTRRDIQEAVEKNGYDPDRGVFIQAFDRPEMDASLLLLPIMGFVNHRDERMIRTTNAVWKDLEEAGLLRRYAPTDDGLTGREGVFLAASFWLAECLARQGRSEEAHKVFKRALATGNDLLLFSEEYDPETREMLGNFPQALTHLSLIAAIVAFKDMEEAR
jgi:GH15 family glucan-1,4-alpha-glucosidase